MSVREWVRGACRCGRAVSECMRVGDSGIIGEWAWETLWECV